MFPTYVQIVTLVFSERQEKTGCTRCPILRALDITCSLLFIYISCLYILQREELIAGEKILLKIDNCLSVSQI